MNIFLIAVLIILIGSMIWGYWRGFIRIVFSLATMILTIALVSWATPHITEFLKENTTIYEDLADQCSQKIQASAEEKVGDKLQENISGEEVEDKTQENTSQEDGNAILGEILPGVQLPELWVEQILEKTGSTVNQFMEESGAYRQVGEYVADWVLRGVAFFAAFLLISLLLKLLVAILDIVAKLPLIKGVNRLLGGAVGLLQGLLIIWLLMFLVAIACTSQIGQTALSYINDSELLTYLYQHNGILYFFNYMFG